MIVIRTFGTFFRGRSICASRLLVFLILPLTIDQTIDKGENHHENVGRKIFQRR